MKIDALSVSACGSEEGFGFKGRLRARLLTFIAWGRGRHASPATNSLTVVNDRHLPLLERTRTTWGRRARAASSKTLCTSSRSALPPCRSVTSGSWRTRCREARLRRRFVVASAGAAATSDAAAVARGGFAGAASAGVSSFASSSCLACFAGGKSSASGDAARRRRAADVEAGTADSDAAAT